MEAACKRSTPNTTMQRDEARRIAAQSGFSSNRVGEERGLSVIGPHSKAATNEKNRAALPLLPSKSEQLQGNQHRRGCRTGAVGPTIERYARAFLVSAPFRAHNKAVGHTRTDGFVLTLRDTNLSKN
jgi:hypothetical protein